MPKKPWKSPLEQTCPGCGKPIESLSGSEAWHATCWAERKK